MEPVRGKVLLVAEDAGAGQLWASALGRHGVEVVVGCDDDLLQQWEEGGFDLVIVDAHDRRCGLEMFRWLKAAPLNPILVLAPDCDETDLVAAYRAGVDECIKKPVSPAILVAKVRAWLRHSWTIPDEVLAARVPPGAGG